ncbi:MAG: hypothetical protein IKB83_02380, partial [Mycoplasmataceae bacterium]|nr:hypothetical protein [Mycoplasmataceae bacterium]
IYFTFKNNLFKIEMKKLDNEIVKIGRESSSKGGWEKLRLQISSAKKQQWIIEGKAKQVMTSEKFIAIAQENGLNKGQTCEYLSAKARKQEYKLDNVRFDKAGDVNLKRKKIQVKFENASLTQLRTIAKVAGLTA